jgi:hypothetical protein
MKIEPPPMYRRGAWTAAILGRSKPDKTSTGPGPIATAIVFAIGLAIGLILLHVFGSGGLSGAGP